MMPGDLIVAVGRNYKGMIALLLESPRSNGQSSFVVTAIMDGRIYHVVLITFQGEWLWRVA